MPTSMKFCAKRSYYLPDGSGKNCEGYCRRRDRQRQSTNAASTRSRSNGFDQALFNTERFESVPLLSAAEAEQTNEDPPALADFPLVGRSVVNYGVPSFSGRSSRDFDRDSLAREIRAILATYEPRLRDSATKVTVALGDKNVGLKIDIDAVLIMTPSPERLRLRTTVNLDNGMARTDITDS